MTRQNVIEANKHRATTREFKTTSEYRIWIQMRARCNNPRNQAYKNYGGRGIQVCDRWADFFAFLQDMGLKPEGKSLDRINNDGNYEPSNCRWADRITQRHNSRGLRLVTYNGRTQCINAWCKELGLSSAAVHTRISKHHMEPLDAFHVPIARFNRGRYQPLPRTRLTVRCS